jgi:hypothetical protein
VRRASLSRASTPDFVVVVKLNKGGKQPRIPEFFVMPTPIVKTAQRAQWGKVRFNAIPHLASYKNAWGKIREFIDLRPATAAYDEEETKTKIAGEPLRHSPGYE